jgi:hypothetical protein
VINSIREGTEVPHLVGKPRNYLVSSTSASSSHCRHARTVANLLFGSGQHLHPRKKVAFVEIIDSAVLLLHPKFGPQRVALGDVLMRSPPLASETASEERREVWRDGQSWGKSVCVGSQTLELGRNRL